MMRELMGWDPFHEMAPFATQLPAGFIPSFEVKETKEGYQFKADLPGVKEEDVKVELEDNVLTISGQRRSEHEEHKGAYHRVEHPQDVHEPPGPVAVTV